MKSPAIRDARLKRLEDGRCVQEDNSIEIRLGIGPMVSLMSLKEKLQEDLKTALKARDELRLSTIRLALSAVRNAEIDKGQELNDEQVTEVISREAKRRREAIEGAKSAGREDFAEKESKELEVLSEYLPKQLGEEEIEQIAREVIAETGAVSLKDRGRVMSALMQRVRGRADGKMVSQVVERILQN